MFVFIYSYIIPNNVKMTIENDFGQISEYQKTVGSQLKLLEHSTEQNIGTTSRSYLRVAQNVHRYADIGNISSLQERSVISNDVITILPSQPSLVEIALAHYLTTETSEALAKFRSKNEVPSYNNTPVVTVMVRTHEEVDTLLPRNTRLSGVISRTIPPFFNILNLQAAKFAMNTFGPDFGLKIILFSYMHEDSHLVYTQARAAQLERNIKMSGTRRSLVDLTIASTVLNPYFKDELYWELWANQLPNACSSTYVDGLPIFPYWTSKQGVDRNFNGKAIYEKRGFDHFSKPHTSHYPDPHQNLDYPFVMDPADAQEYLKVEEYIREIKDPKFKWFFERNP